MARTHQRRHRQIAAPLGQRLQIGAGPRAGKAGFTLRYDRNGTFDLAHFTEHQIREFSARSQQIEAALAAKGLNRDTATHAEKNQAALSTRQRKVEVDREAVRQEWQKRAGDLAIDFHSRQWEGAGRDGVDDRAKRLPPKEIEKPLEHHADKAVQFAIKSLTERNAIVKQSELVEVALTHGFGRLTTDDVRAALDRAARSGHLIRDLPVYVSMNPADKKKGGAEDRPAPLAKSGSPPWKPVASREPRQSGWSTWECAAGVLRNRSRASRPTSRRSENGTSCRRNNAIVA
ncbi:relaxase domain-containing protein (plasmid) [Xanthomonas hortorum pv. pelargonii]|nr:relaxase domain-containing protein [Xanthomonas hortorum pv. pelargonii]